MKDEIENVFQLNRRFVLEITAHAEREARSIQRRHRRIEQHLHLLHFGAGLAVPEESAVVPVRHFHVLDQLTHIGHHGVEVEQRVPG